MTSSFSNSSYSRVMCGGLVRRLVGQGSASTVMNFRNDHASILWQQDKALYLPWRLGRIKVEDVFIRPLNAGGTISRHARYKLTSTGKADPGCWVNPTVPKTSGCASNVPLRRVDARITQYIDSKMGGPAYLIAQPFAGDDPLDPCPSETGIGNFADFVVPQTELLRLADPDVGRVRIVGLAERRVRPGFYFETRQTGTAKIRIRWDLTFRRA